MQNPGMQSRSPMISGAPRNWKLGFLFIIAFVEYALKTGSQMLENAHECRVW